MNPNVGRFYTEQWPKLEKNGADDNQLRATLSYEKDFRRIKILNRGLGRFTLAALYNNEGVAAILATFKTDTTSRLKLLQTAVATADAAEIRTQAHAISGSARLVGADDIVSVCRIIEEAANGSSAGLSKLVELIRTRFEEIRCAIDVRISQPSGVEPR